jgi:phage-related protein
VGNRLAIVHVEVDVSERDHAFREMNGMIEMRNILNEQEARKYLGVIAAVLRLTPPGRRRGVTPAMHSKSCINKADAIPSGTMALRKESQEAAELHFEGDSLEVLSGFPDEVKRALGFSLRQLQIGREPTSQTRSMSSIGSGVYELKEADERAWYRAIYLSRVGNTIYVLHCFEKEGRKTDRRDIEVAGQRLKVVRQRLQEQKAHEKRSGK